MNKLGGTDFIREKVRIRDKHTCQCCGKKWKKGMRRFDVHHQDEDFEGLKGNSKKGIPSRNKGVYEYDKNNFDKLITYCHKCHMNLDSVKRKMVEKVNKNQNYYGNK